MLHARSFQQPDAGSTMPIPAQFPMENKAPESARGPAQHTAPATAPIVAVQQPPFADATALGLFGLAIGCASLLPVAFGVKTAFTPDALRTTAWFCLLFGAGCQFLAGMISLVNKNMLGGTLLTAFSFNWVMNWWSLSELSQGRVPNESVVLAVDACFLVIFIAMTFAFGYFSKLLFVFLLDIVALYGLRIGRALTHSPAFVTPIAGATVVLMLVSLYIALSLVLANASGRVILPLGGPMWKPRAGGAAPSAH